MFAPSPITMAGPSTTYMQSLYGAVGSGVGVVAQLDPFPSQTPHSSTLPDPQHSMFAPSPITMAGPSTTYMQSLYGAVGSGVGVAAQLDPFPSQTPHSSTLPDPQHSMFAPSPITMAGPS